MIVTMMLCASTLQAKDYLVKLKNQKSATAQMKSAGFDDWYLVEEKDLSIKNKANIEYIQPNYKISLLHNFQSNDPVMRQMAQKALAQKTVTISDNPQIPPNTPERRIGLDPLFSKQWGMKDIGVENLSLSPRKIQHEVVVAVLDTGVDYTHPDLVSNIWRNEGETGVDSNGKNKESNGIDDDGNGYVDDVVGWDFAGNDSFPYDLTLSPMDIILKGGNPGHGTHCAGNVAARSNNATGISGVAGMLKIMPLRFLSEKGEGTTLDAVKAIRYAVDNGAKVLSNSWGSEGEDSNDAENRILRETIEYAQERGVLFIAAAGNGHQGKGYDNDTDAKPGYPASYSYETIVSVAAIDAGNELGSFSNWGKNSVDLAAPGVKVFSTVPLNKYSDVVIDLFGMKVTWDGTSMATPHVAGAAALYWSLHPEKQWYEIKEDLLKATVKVASLRGKIRSEGKLNLNNLIR